MPTLKESLTADRSGYEPVVDIGRNVTNLPTPPEGQPTINPFLRCPFPPVSITPDSLRQYYVGGQVPQFRILTPTKRVTSGSGVSNIITVSANTSVATGGTSPTINKIVATNISLTTATISPSELFLGQILTSKSFQLLSISANSPCRIEIYGSQADQLLDVSRQLDVAPFPGTQQNLITDLALDAVPYQWSWQNRVGANSESPQNGVIYMTVTNLGGVSAAITVSLVYVPLEA